MSGTAPSKGTKVDLGQNAPVVQEGAGAVPNESLAAESVRAGGDFTDNRNINVTDDTGATSTGSTGSSQAPAGVPQSHQPSSGATGTEQGQTAPSYVQSQFTVKDSAGPHGKNITEDPEMTGRPGAFSVEVGSKQDPGRVAEHDMKLKQTHGLTGTGERQGGVDEEQPYSALGNETSA